MCAAICMLAFSLRAAPIEESNYRLTSNDVIDFRVFQEPDMDSVIRISGDGNATFPFIGSIMLGGKTIPEAVAGLRERYLDGYLGNPQVSITIREYARRRFTVMGQVQKPGPFEISGNENVNLLQAIGMAGGFTRMANPSKITIKRTEKGQERILQVDAKKMGHSESDRAFAIKSGDVIIVEESLF